MGGGQTTTSKSEPWKVAQPYLKDIMSSAANLYGQDPTGYTPPSDYTTQGIDQIAGIAGDPNSLTSQARGTISGLMDYDMAGIGDAVRSQVMPAVNSTFQSAGRSGSPAHTGTMTKEMTRALAPFQLQARDQAMRAATLAPAMQYGDADRLMQAGQYQDQINREENQAPWQRLGQYSTFGTQIGGMGGTQTQTQPGQSPFQTIAGLGLGAMGLFSDERLKQDVKRVGKTDDGLPVYTYSYKDDPERVTHMGVMAQEAAQKKPGAVFDTGGGLLAVDYSQVA